jgi:RNA-directed DNA polymerase
LALLANVLLDEVDRESERRDHCFARCADDANVYVRSQGAGERVMTLLRRLYDKSHLVVNESKSVVGSVFGRKFLGYSLWMGRGKVVKLEVGDTPLATFKQPIRELTGRSGGRSMVWIVDKLRTYMFGSLRLRTLTDWECHACRGLNYLNRLVRTRVPGDVAGAG